MVTIEQSDTAHLVKRLRDMGFSYMEIGRHLGVHWRTVYRWGRNQNHPWAMGPVNKALAGMIRIQPSGRQPVDG